MRTGAIVVLLATGASLSACSMSTHSSELQVSDNTVNGLPYRVRDQFEVELYERTAKGYVRVAQRREMIADPTHVYVAHVNGQALASGKVQVAIFPDSTLKEFEVASDSQLDEAVTSVGGAYKDLATANANLRKARKADDKADVDEAEAVLAGKETNQVSLSKALSAVMVAEHQLAELSADELASVRSAKEGEIERLKIEANIAARKAGAPTPY